MKTYDIAIIGAGPAGLAAAAFALNVQLKVAIIAPDMGGKIANNFGMNALTPASTIWGVDLVNQLATFVQSQPFDHINDSAHSVTQNQRGEFEVTLATADQRLLARTVIVATGVKPERMYVPGELEFWGKGVSFSALSHAAVFHNKDVLVVGYNNRALAALLKLSALAHQVYWLPIGVKKASEKLVSQVERLTNVDRINQWHLQCIKGDETVKQVELVKGYDIRNLDVAGVFVELGWLANTEFLGELIPLEEESGHVPVNFRCETARPGLFAAGDVTTVFAERIPVAIGEGMKAAISAWEYCISTTSE